MSTAPFLINALINDTFMLQALVDSGCLCSGVINDELSKKLQLPRIPIPPRSLQTAENTTVNKPVVRNITFISIDLDGYTIPKLWLYIVPHITHALILGKKWLEDQDAVIHSKEQRLELRKGNISVYSAKVWRQKLRKAVNPKVTSLADMTCLMKEVPVCKASIEDINKALRSKSSLTLEEAQKSLPLQVKNFAHLFADDAGAQDLPKHRRNLGGHCTTCREKSSWYYEKH